MGASLEQHEALSASLDHMRIFEEVNMHPVFPWAHATAASVRIRTKLYTAAAKVNIHPTRATPRCRVLRSSPTVLIQPKISSMHLRFR